MSRNGTSRSFDSPDSRLQNDPILRELHRRFDRLDQGFDGLANSIADLRAAMCEGFAEMHRRFDRIDQLHLECMEIVARIEAMFVGELRPGEH
jgi:hypothetical protein